jgi:hypothetical protein
MKFLEQVQHQASHFWVGVSGQVASRVMALSQKGLLLEKQSPA